MNRTIQITNIKKHKDKYIDFTNGTLFAFLGRNGSGKSTIIQCLESIALVDKTILNPVTTGENSGKVVREGVDRNGNPITIEWEVTAEQSVFRATYLDPKGDKKTISDPKRIRELLGSYFPLTVNEVFEMLKYAEGRRKFIKEYIYACLTAEQRQRLYDLDVQVTDKKNKDTENNLFHTRTRLTRELEAAQTLVRNLLVTPAEEEQIKLLPKLEEQMAKLKALQKDRQGVEVAKTLLNSMYADSEAVIAKFNAYVENELWDWTDDQKALIAQFNEFLGGTQVAIQENIKSKDALLVDEPGKLPLDERIKIGDQKILDARTYDGKQTQRSAALESAGKLETQIAELTTKIEQAREQRMDIIKNSPLPAGLSFDEETITLNGFVFNESVVSETEARLAIMELICSTTTSDFVVIGDWSLYDTESRKKILDMAKKSNRMVFGQLVTDDDDVQCQTIIID